MNNYEILEICLQELDQGVDVETLLARYPDHADELRPILTTSMNARSMAVSEPSSEVIKRNRAKLLQRAAQLRKQEKKAFAFMWFPSFRRLAATFVIVVTIFFSGIRLVSASSTSLPGDKLYPVKRSWEDIILFFTFDMKMREAREVEYEVERLDELKELFASGRTAEVDFVGEVTSENGDGWWISNILVIVSPQTRLPNQPIQIGMAVRVEGMTRGNGIVLAEKIELLPAGVPLPEGQDEHSEDETEHSEATPMPGIVATSPAYGMDAQEANTITNTSPTPTPKIESFTGVLQSIQQNTWKVDNILVNVENAEIEGVPVIGGLVKVEGYFAPEGVFIAKKIEIINSGSDNTNLNSNSNTNDNQEVSNSGNTNTSGEDNNNINLNVNGDDDHSGSGN